MNIYLHIEISARELDSKLLLATIAAARGHVVILSDLELILKGLLKGYLEPGIYHTKSLTPSTVKIDRHQALMDKGSIITSIDEESGLHTHGYEKFSKMRYSKKTISQFSEGVIKSKSFKAKLLVCFGSVMRLTFMLVLSSRGRYDSRWRK